MQFTLLCSFVYGKNQPFYRLFAHHSVYNHAEELATITRCIIYHPSHWNQLLSYVLRCSIIFFLDVAEFATTRPVKTYLHLFNISVPVA